MSVIEHELAPTVDADSRLTPDAGTMEWHQLAAELLAAKASPMECILVVAHSPSILCITRSLCGLPIALARGEAVRIDDGIPRWRCSADDDAPRIVAGAR
jgi:hypothetical protein